MNFFKTISNMESFSNIENDNNDFKKEHSFEKRLAESKRIMASYKDRIPVVIQKKKDSTTPNIDKNKYLIPSDCKMNMVTYVVRKRIRLSPEKTIFFFVNNTIPKQNELISSVYQEHKDDDGFLYIYYSGESCFGNI
jgi:GABA(A) receptor-associated protein